MDLENDNELFYKRSRSRNTTNETVGITCGDYIFSGVNEESMGKYCVRRKFVLYSSYRGP